MQEVDAVIAGTKPQPSDCSEDKWIRIDISEQKLYLLSRDSVNAEYQISTSQFGIGNQKNSCQTPTGWHRICLKIGFGEPPGMIFKARKPIGKIAKIVTDTTDVIEDVITTRILRLEGLEPGLNNGEEIDSFDRCIYIHGTNEEGLIGTPSSHGCIRLKNMDILDLFDRVSDSTLVLIEY